MTSITQGDIEEAFKTEETLNSLATKISKDVSNGVYDISHFVEVLGFALTATSTDKRVKGTQILSEVLAKLPKDLLNEKQIEFLTIFYADRVKDQHNVIPHVIEGMSALVHMKNIPPTCIPVMLQRFFQATNCQSQTRGDRTKIFLLFKYLTSQYPTVLKGMSADFISDVIQSIDGERDPRNLDLIFSFMPSVIASFPMFHLSEEMFETFACYFPVDFTPNRSDPDVITRDQLAQNLIKCLVASEEFVEWAISLAVEKLATDLVSARLDSLNLLQEAALHFEAKSLEPFFEQIWKVLKPEVFPGGDNASVVSSALTTLRCILERAAPFTEISHNYQTIVLGTILTHLNNVGTHFFNPATAIALVCVASDYKFASEKVLAAFQLKLDGTTELTNNELIRIYTVIAQIYKIVGLKDATMEQVNNNVSLQIQKKAIASLRQELDSEMIKEEILDVKRSALSVLNECAPILTEEHRALIYQTLVRLTAHEQIDLEFRHFIEQLGALYPIEVQSNVLDICIRNFPIFNNFVKSKILRNMTSLVHQMAFSEIVLGLLYDNIFSDQIPNDVCELSLKALSDLLNTSDNQFIVELQHQTCLIDKLIQLAKKQSHGVPSIGVLEKIAAVLSTVIQRLSITEQYTIVTEKLPNLNLQMAADLYVTKGLLGFLHQDISLDDHFERLLNDLAQLSLKSDNAELRHVAHLLICSMVNKIENNEQNRNVIFKIIETLEDEIKSENAKAVEALSWLAKGLIVRGHEGVADIVQSLADLLDHPSLVTAAVLAFNIISAEFPELHLPVVKYLFKQKYFQIIIQKFGTKLEAYCEHHINAFVYVLKATPHAVLKMNIEKVGPTLFKSLESTKTETLCISLNIIEHFIKERNEYFRSHLNHIIPSCLQLSTFKDTMAVRIAALNLLHDITSYPTFVLLPYKMDVVLELAPALDDPKRLVRNAAVQARNDWFLIGANPNESPNIDQQS